MLKQSGVEPLYVQIREIIITKIERNELKPGDQIPTEAYLTKKYGVSRITVRKAVQDLVDDDILIRKQGKGTFVAVPKIERELITVNSFSKRMSEKGFIPGAKVLSKELIEPSSTVCKFLQVEKNAEVIAIQRLRFLDKEPVAIEKSYIPYESYPLVLEANINIGSLYKFLEEEYNVSPGKSEKTLEIIKCNEFEAKHLNISVGEPLFLLTGAIYTTDNRSIEYVKTVFKGDRFRFKV